jgi:hypothetical protein
MGFISYGLPKVQLPCVLHIVKDVVVIFREAFHPSIRRPSCHPSMDGIIEEETPGKNK